MSKFRLQHQLGFSLCSLSRLSVSRSCHQRMGSVWSSISRSAQTLWHVLAHCGAGSWCRLSSTTSMTALIFAFWAVSQTHSSPGCCLTAGELTRWTTQIPGFCSEGANEGFSPYGDLDHLVHHVCIPECIDLLPTYPRIWSNIIIFIIIIGWFIILSSSHIINRDDQIYFSRTKTYIFGEVFVILD